MRTMLLVPPILETSMNPRVATTALPRALAAAALLLTLCACGSDSDVPPPVPGVAELQRGLAEIGLEDIQKTIGVKVRHVFPNVVPPTDLQTVIDPATSPAS